MAILTWTHQPESGNWDGTGPNDETAAITETGHDLDSQRYFVHVQPGVSGDKRAGFWGATVQEVKDKAEKYLADEEKLISEFPVLS